MSNKQTTYKKFASTIAKYAEKPVFNSHNKKQQNMCRLLFC